MEHVQAVLQGFTYQLQQQIIACNVFHALKLVYNVTNLIIQSFAAVVDNL